MKYIKINNFQYPYGIENISILVDDEDFEKLNKYNWFLQKNKNTWYARRNIIINRAKKHLFMHREILNAPKNKDVDHINNNGLDNRKENLRLCSRSENLAKKRWFGKIKTSLFKGVCWDKQRQSWIAQITLNYKHFNLGRFKSEKAAAKAYNISALKFFKNFAYLNEI